MILFTGAGSEICESLMNRLTSEGYQELFPLRSRDCDFRDLSNIGKIEHLIRRADRLVLAHGVIHSKTFLDMAQEEVLDSLRVNLLSTVHICELALKHNEHARICVIGSESGLKHSHDTCYGLGKMALHGYVRERRIKYPGQQLVCVAPSLIEDGGMTLRRKDQDNVEKVKRSNPKGRGVMCREVADMVYTLLWDQPYVSNTVIEMYGSKFARA